MAAQKRDFYIRKPFQRYEVQEKDVAITDKWENQGVKYRNSLISSPLVFGGAGISAGGAGGGAAFAGGWPEAVQKMGKWFEQNIHSYQGGGCPGKPGRGDYAGDNPLCIHVGPRCDQSGRSMYKCDILQSGKVQADCSAFVYACLMLFKPDVFPGLDEIHNSPTADLYSTPSNSKWVNKLREVGFKDRQWTSMDDINPFEIYSGGSRFGAIGHTEICAETKGKQYGWGSVHDGIKGRPGMPCNRANGKYITIWAWQ